jgi:glutamate 5-kinase
MKDNQLTSAAAGRSDILSARRLVVKVGSRLLTGQQGGIDTEFVDGLVRQIADLKREGKEVLLVTSGAIAAGSRELGLKKRPSSLPALQAAAAVGQTVLMHIYHQAFRKQGFRIGQVLLTREGLHHRDRHLNARHTLLALLERGIIPVINENDTVAVDEIKFGDNDQLAALLANLVRADLLVLLSDVDGLLAGSGRLGREVIDRVEKITPAVTALVRGCPGEHSRGGMGSKLAAAGIVTRAGVQAVIANGMEPNVLLRVVRGESVGTYFPTSFGRLRSRKCWIAFSCLKKGRILVDEGARRALAEGGKSLLASGITAVEGPFSAGDMVTIAGPDGIEFSRGLVNYSSREVEKIRGAKTGRIKSLLGYKPYNEVVHRDNLLVL